MNSRQSIQKTVYRSSYSSGRRLEAFPALHTW